MTQSIVKVSMRDDNDLGCSYAIVSKGQVSVIIVLKDSECAIFDYNLLKMAEYEYHYLLLKHYGSDRSAYQDFLKLIGKMCKKHEDSKYFLNRKSEDNRMVVSGAGGAHMISGEERAAYEERYILFRAFILQNRGRF